MVGFGQDRDEFPRRDAFSDLSDGLDSAIKLPIIQEKSGTGLSHGDSSGFIAKRELDGDRPVLPGAILFLGEVSEPIIGAAVGDRAGEP